MFVDTQVSFPHCLTGHAARVDEGLNRPCERHEISVNGKRYYCSGKEKDSEAREVSSVISEKIGRNAIKGYFICAQTVADTPPSHKRKRQCLIGFPTNCILKRICYTNAPARLDTLG